MQSELLFNARESKSYTAGGMRRVETPLNRKKQIKCFSNDYQMLQLPSTNIIVI